MISSDSFTFPGATRSSVGSIFAVSFGSFAVTGYPAVDLHVHRGAGAGRNPFRNPLHARMNVVLHVVVERADRADQPRAVGNDVVADARVELPD